MSAKVSPPSIALLYTKPYIMRPLFDSSSLNKTTDSMYYLHARSQKDYSVMVERWQVYFDQYTSYWLRDDYTHMFI